MGGRWAVATSKSWNEKKWSCESQIFPNLVLYVNCQLSNEHSREANSNCRACEKSSLLKLLILGTFKFLHVQDIFLGANYPYRKIPERSITLQVTDKLQGQNITPKGWGAFFLVVVVVCVATLSYHIYSLFTQRWEGFAFYANAFFFCPHALW